jgi:hypothetical protein
MIVKKRSANPAPVDPDLTQINVACNHHFVEIKKFFWGKMGNLDKMNIQGKYGRAPQKNLHRL